MIVKLKKNEVKLIDDVWNFICLLKNKKLNNLVKLNYDVKTFYKLEIILEKLYWKLKIILHNYFNENNYYHEKKIKQNEKDKILRLNKMNKNLFREKNIIYYKDNERIDIDYLIDVIMNNRSIYETIILDPNKIDEIKFNKSYGNFNIIQTFPNINNIKPFIESKYQRLERIKLMYY